MTALFWPISPPQKKTQRGAGFSSRKPDSGADFGRGPRPTPEATVPARADPDLPSLISQRVQRSSRNPCRRCSRPAAKQQHRSHRQPSPKAGISTLQVSLADSCRHSATDCLPAAQEAFTPTPSRSMMPVYSELPGRAAGCKAASAQSPQENPPNRRGQAASSESSPSGQPRCPWRVVLKTHWRRTSTRDFRAGPPAGKGWQRQNRRGEREQLCLCARRPAGLQASRQAGRCTDVRMPSRACAAHTHMRACTARARHALLEMAEQRYKGAFSALSKARSQVTTVALVFPYASCVPGCESSVLPASVPVGVGVTSKPGRQLGPDRDLFSGTASLIAWLPLPAHRLLQGQAHCRSPSGRVTPLSAGPARALISVRHDGALCRARDSKQTKNTLLGSNVMMM